MARLTAPLLSLAASGKFANTLVCSVWKGIPVMRQYVVPSNPQTPDQVTQRARMTALVNCWRLYVTATVDRTAWNRAALLEQSAMSGFNSFVRHLMTPYATAATSAFGKTATALTGNTVSYDAKKLSDGTASTEAGNFELWAGTQPDSLLLKQSVAIVAGVITYTVDLGTTGDVIYTQIQKAGTKRTGIDKITLIA